MTGSCVRAGGLGPGGRFGGAGSRGRRAAAGAAAAIDRQAHGFGWQ